MDRQGLLFLCLMLPLVSHAEEGSRIFYAFNLEVGSGITDDGHDTTKLDLDGWIGGDDHKLSLKAEVEREYDETERFELWAMYSRNISAFWDLQAGIRRDIQPEGISYLIFGFAGLAPFFIESEAHVFVDEYGDIGARLRQAKTLLITQKFYLEPYLETNFFGGTRSDSEVGSGLADAEVGLKTCYELNRSFAPCFDIRYERKLGSTASIARRRGEDVESAAVYLGIKMLF